MPPASAVGALRTTPENSEPATQGKAGWCWYLPRIWRRSKKLVAEAWMAIRYSSDLGVGVGRSRTLRSSGPWLGQWAVCRWIDGTCTLTYSLICMPFMVGLDVSCDAKVVGSNSDHSVRSSKVNSGMQHGRCSLHDGGQLLSPKIPRHASPVALPHPGAWLTHLSKRNWCLMHGHALAMAGYKARVHL